MVVVKLDGCYLCYTCSLANSTGKYRKSTGRGNICNSDVILLLVLHSLQDKLGWKAPEIYWLTEKYISDGTDFNLGSFQKSGILLFHLHSPLFCAGVWWLLIYACISSYRISSLCTLVTSTEESKIPRSLLPSTCSQ